MAVVPHGQSSSEGACADGSNHRNQNRGPYWHFAERIGLRRRGGRKRPTRRLRGRVSAVEFSCDAWYVPPEKVYVVYAPYLPLSERVLARTLH